MDRVYEERYAQVEERHPWFVARRDIFSRLAGHDRDARILDIGCGTGLFLAHLRKLGFRHLTGVELSAELRSKFRDPSIPVLPDTPNGTYDKVFMLDVLEHIADDRGMLSRVYDLLEPGGRYYASVPAHPFLWSEHDELNHHQRRYRKRELGEKLRNAGFRVRTLTYWNMFAFPAVCLQHAVGSGKRSSELDRGSEFTLRVLGTLLGIENWLVERVSLPVGLSVIAIGESV